MTSPSPPFVFNHVNVTINRQEVIAAQPGVWVKLFDSLVPGEDTPSSWRILSNLSGADRLFIRFVSAGNPVAMGRDAGIALEPAQRFSLEQVVDQNNIISVTDEVWGYFLETGGTTRDIGILEVVEVVEP